MAPTDTPRLKRLIVFYFDPRTRWPGYLAGATVSITGWILGWWL